MAIYLTHRDRLQKRATGELVSVVKQNIPARIRLEFCFYKETMNLESFKQQSEEGLCQAQQQQQSSW